MLIIRERNYYRCPEFTGFFDNSILFSEVSKNPVNSGHKTAVAFSYNSRYV